MLQDGYETDHVLQLDTNLDDLTAEVLAFASERLRENGALDVWITPILMKKNRPAHTLSVLCEKEAAPRLADILFAETTAFGLRITEVTRLKLRRDFIAVETRFGQIKVKLGFRGDVAVQISPEFESCKKAAANHQVPVREVFEAATSAARAHLGNLVG